MRKAVFCSLIFFIVSFACFAQVFDSTILEYKNGYQKFENLVSHETSVADITSYDSFYKKPYFFYLVMFQVNKYGKIGDVWINSIYDSILSSSILAAIEKSSGFWINHSGENLLAVLPVYYNNVDKEVVGNATLKEVYEHIDNTDSLKIFDRFYKNGQPAKTVHLKAIKIVALSPIH